MKAWKTFPYVRWVLAIVLAAGIGIGGWVFAAGAGVGALAIRVLFR